MAMGVVMVMPMRCCMLLLQAAFRVGMGFLSANASRRVGSQGLKCQDVVDLLQGITGR